MYGTIKTFRYLLPAICCLICACTHAQQLHLRHFTVKDGLTGNTVYNSFQDSKGFMWFCTSEGISRFDGHTFENFTTREGLPDNEVFMLKEDFCGRIWVTSYNAKACFIQNGKVFNAANNIFCQLAEQDSVLQKIRLDAGHTSPDTLLKDIPGLAWRLSMYAYVNANEVIHLCHRSDKDVFFTHNFTCIVANGKIKVLPTRSIVSYYANGFIYQGIVEGEKKGVIRKVELAADTVNFQVNSNIPIAAIYSFAVLNDSALLVATDKGVLTYMPTSNKIDSEKMILRNIPVSSIKKDVENNFWFTTLNDGVYFLPASKPVIYRKNNNSAATIAILPSGTLVAGYDGGQVHIIDERVTPGLVLPNLAMKDRVLKIIPLSNMKLVLGTDVGIYTIDIATRTVTRHDYYPLKSAIKDLYDRNGYVFFSGVHGAGEIDSNGNLQRYWGNRTTAIAASDTAVWLGTLQGVFKYGAHTGVRRPELSPLLSKSRITDIEIAPNGDVIFLTHQAGLFIWNGKAVQHIDEQAGLSSNICRKALIDDEQNIWVSTNCGLDKLIFNNGRYTTSHFPLFNGIAKNDISDFTIARGKLYISCEEGIAKIDIEQNKTSSPLRTYITSVALSDTVFINPGNISLSHRQASLTINYTAIAFGDGQNLVYKYILVGGKGDTVATKLASVNLDAISPGNYTFKVWAKGSDDIWAKEPAVFSFTIEPPLWRKTWFILSALLIAIMTVYALVKKRINNIRRTESAKTKLNRKMANLEMQALRAQINPHFIFNALNAIQNYYNQNDERNANRYMTMFANLIRQTLTHSKDNWIRLSEEADMLRAYIELEKMRFKNIFDYRITISTGIDAENTRIPAMMIQPFVENAINHGLRHLCGTPGNLDVSFTLTEHGILCVIDDTGVGFKQAAAIEKEKRIHQPMGMDIMKSRINTMNMLYNTSSIINVIHKNEITPHDCGTTIEIIIPLIKTINDE